MSLSYQINIRADSGCRPWSDLAPVLEYILPVKFVFSRQAPVLAVGEIIPELVGPELEVTDAPKAISTLSVSSAGNKPEANSLCDFTVQFADDDNVPFPFRGRSLQTKIAQLPEILSPGGNERVLASCPEGPVWTATIANGVKCFRSAFAIPSIPKDGNLHDIFRAAHFLEMLPVFDFIQRICAPSLFEGPSSRACFIFDDPNLHWPRYGSVDFKEIAANAAKHNYHVSFATIPLDGWFIHQPTAEIFRRNAGRLSLAVHGNNHTRWELAQDVSKPTRISLLNQAIHRIEHLEHKAGLRVSRAMVPPHGACSEAMLADLPGCGFEVATISHGSLRAHNPGCSWIKTLGYLPLELIQGCPVLPRWGLTGDLENTILLAAYLKQPIILRGHQEDLKNGIELLNRLAQFINSLAPTHWGGIEDLSRSIFQWRLNGGVFYLKPLGRKMDVQLPEECQQLMIENVNGSAWDRWTMRTADGTTFEVRSGELVSLGKINNKIIQIEAPVTLSVPQQNGTYRTTMRTVVRRVLTEARDRFFR